jgi:phosphatidylinositol glycan class M
MSKWGISLRLFLLIYGVYQDTHPVLKYTDIDYSVFTDASRFVLDNQSPYNRATFRYTPLLAWILLGNNYVEIFGKLLFATCDIIVGMLLETMLKQRGYSQSYDYGSS